MRLFLFLVVVVLVALAAAKPHPTKKPCDKKTPCYKKYSEKPHKYDCKSRSKESRSCCPNNQNVEVKNNIKNYIVNRFNFKHKNEMKCCPGVVPSQPPPKTPTPAPPTTTTTTKPPCVITEVLINPCRSCKGEILYEGPDEHHYYRIVDECPVLEKCPDNGKFDRERCACESAMQIGCIRFGGRETWQGAFDYCNVNNQAMIMLTSDSKSNWLEDTMARHNGPSYNSWIGLKCDDQGENCVWNNGHPLDFLVDLDTTCMWGFTEIKGNCGVMRFDRVKKEISFYLDDCEAEHETVCYLKNAGIMSFRGCRYIKNDFFSFVSPDK